MTQHCPNCGSAVEAESSRGREGPPIRCDVCGYRSEAVLEYFWIYLGGVILTVQGFAAGAIAFLGEGEGPGHWIHAFAGWYPIAPWPEGYTWLGFLVDGILLTIMGIGITRHKPASWWTITLWTVYKLGLAAAAAGGTLGTTTSGWFVGTVVGVQVVTIGLLLRIKVALRRTPARDTVELQRRAREASASQEPGQDLGDTEER